AAAEKMLQRFKDRFCDVSLFVKELKERFSRWFNPPFSPRSSGPRAASRPSRQKQIPSSQSNS
ncbi:MAG: hypothetical protein ACJAVK_002552, partial [Akkermansiaceae bacterium]